MYDKELYWKNRSREAIADMFRVIRYVQQVNNFSDSQIIRTMMTVWEATEQTTSFAKLHLFWMANELEKDEKSKRAQTQAEERRSRE
jgi:hypothetical protein